MLGGVLCHCWSPNLNRPNQFMRQPLNCIEVFNLLPTHHHHHTDQLSPPLVAGLPRRLCGGCAAAQTFAVELARAEFEGRAGRGAALDAAGGGGIERDRLLLGIDGFQKECAGSAHGGGNADGKAISAIQEEAKARGWGGRERGDSAKRDCDQEKWRLHERVEAGRAGRVRIPRIKHQRIRVEMFASIRHAGRKGEREHNKGMWPHQPF